MKIQLNIPTKWNDIPTRALEQIAHATSFTPSGPELDFKIFFALINLRWWQIRKYLKASKVLKLVPIDSLKEHWSFIYTAADLTKFIPAVKTSKKVFFAPANRMNNITAEQFELCEDLMFHFNQTKNIEYLRYIAAILYLEANTDFNKAGLDAKVVSFKHLKEKTLLAIGFAYKGSSTEIQTMYKHVFKKGIPNQKNPPKPTAPNFGNLVHFLAKTSEVFNGLKDAKTANVHDFLHELNQYLKHN